MATPDFILRLREKIGHESLWVPGCTAVVLRRKPVDDGEAEDQQEADPGWLRRDGVTDRSQVEVLVVRRADNDKWTPVTGIVDPGEQPARACQREIEEEAGVVAVPVRLLSVDVVGPVTYPNGDVSEYLDTAFLFEWVSGDPFPADGENSEARFVAVADLPEMNDRFVRVIERALSNEVEAQFELSGRSQAASDGWA